MDKKLAKVIKDYKEKIPTTQHGLFAKCYELSVCFHNELFASGLRGAKVVELRLNLGEINFYTCHALWRAFCGKELTTCHYAVLYKGYIIDWTAIQFDNDLPVPLVYKNYRGRVRKEHERLDKC